MVRSYFQGSPGVFTLPMGLRAHLLFSSPSSTDSHIQYERVGADVTMKCGSMDWDAAVTWTANGTDIDDSHLNGSYLILKNVDLTQSGQYSCYEGSSWHLKYQTYLRVGSEYPGV